MTKKEFMAFQDGASHMAYPDITYCQVDPQCFKKLHLSSRDDKIAERGHVGRIIDKIYVNEEKKTVTVKFADNTIQTVRCSSEDTFDPVVGAAIAVSSYIFGNKKNFHDVVNRKIKKASK